MNTIHQEMMEILYCCDAIYEAVKDKEGRRLTPLVAYAGKYMTSEGEAKHYVGEAYYDFAWVEQRPLELRHFSALLAESLRGLEASVALGAPMGGIALALSVADRVPCGFAFAEKKVIAVGTPASREKSELVIRRHSIPPGSRVVIVEDVCNNFSTTVNLTELVDSLGSKVVAIACAINRSAEEVDVWKEELPVISVLALPTPQWRQGDPYVADDVVAGKVVWDPKASWGELLAMQRDASKGA